MDRLASLAAPQCAPERGLFKIFTQINELPIALPVTVIHNDLTEANGATEKQMGDKDEIFN